VKRTPGAGGVGGTGAAGVGTGVERTITGEEVETGVDAGELETTGVEPEEFDHAVYQGKKGVVFAHADVLSGADFAAALADQNATCAYDFSGVFFDAQTLAMRIAAVTGRTTCFFVSHISRIMGQESAN
jgi:hypothetical protein